MSTPDPAAEPGPFEVKDCALITIATGERAYTLNEFRDILTRVGGDSIYYHFWGGLLEPRFEEREFANDFAAWARHGLHDSVLAERLAMLDPTDYPELEDLRQEVVDQIELRLDENDLLPWVRATRQFEFLRSQIVVFDTHRRLASPRELARVVPELSTTSLFYHFVDARRRHPDTLDDFRYWLSGFDEACTRLCARLADLDPHFGPLTELRRELTAIFDEYLENA